MNLLSERSFTKKPLITMTFGTTTEPFAVARLDDTMSMKTREQVTEFDCKPEFASGRLDPALSVAENVRRLLPLMSKNQIEELSALVRKHYAVRYKKRRHPKYGTLNKGFNEKELMVFLHSIDSPKMKLLFEFQANLGLRIGEVVKVRISDIDLESRELVVRTEKTNLLDSLIIPLPLFKETIEYAQANKEEIAQSGGYLFFRDAKHSKRKEGYLEANYVRNKFRFYLGEAKLDDCYDVSEEQGGRSIRRLHRLTTHSLRHFAITRFAKTCNGNVWLASKFARHTDPSTTNTYLHADKKDVYDVIDSIAVGEVALLKKRLSEGASA
jgi:integrase